MILLIFPEFITHFLVFPKKNSENTIFCRKYYLNTKHYTADLHFSLECFLRHLRVWLWFLVFLADRSLVCRHGWCRNPVLALRRLVKINRVYNNYSGIYLKKLFTSESRVTTQSVRFRISFELLYTNVSTRRTVSGELLHTNLSNRRGVSRELLHTNIFIRRAFTLHLSRLNQCCIHIVVLRRRKVTRVTQNSVQVSSYHTC